MTRFPARSLSLLQALDDARFVTIADECFSLVSPRQHAAFEIDRVVAVLDEKRGGSGGPSTRTTDAHDQSILGEISEMIRDFTERNVDGPIGVPGLPLLVLAHIQEKCAVAHEGERFLDVDIAKFGHAATFRWYCNRHYARMCS